MADLASAVVTKQAARVIRRIPTGAILALAMIGLAQRGPIGEATLVLDFPEYQGVYGGYTVNSEATPAVQGFFDGGGTRLWFSRTVHCSVAHFERPTTQMHQPRRRRPLRARSPPRPVVHSCVARNVQ